MLALKPELSADDYKHIIIPLAQQMKDDKDLEV